VTNAHLLSFANRRYRGSLSRIRREAKVMNRFASIHTVDERWLGTDYWQQHADTVRRHRRGYGLWTWKPHAIRRHLEQLPAGDMLVYCDAGCSLNAEGRSRLEEYVALAAGHPTGVLAFKLDGLVGQWTKRATLAAFHADDPAMREREMVAATALVLRAGSETLDLVREWEARMRDVAVVDDSPSPQGEHPEFRNHRHDQSLFTLLAHERALQRIPDETWFGDEWDGFRHFPIHARRWRHALPWSQGWMRRGLWRV
jgi:hypothetical protein